MTQKTKITNSVATGTDVEIHSDAMSKEAVIKIEFPPSGPFISEEELAEVFSKFRGDEPRRLRDVREILKAADFHSTEGGAPLSQTAFYKRARMLLDTLDEVLVSFSTEQTAAISNALDTAFQLGLTIATARLRDKHLVDVEREGMMKAARARGGDNRRGKFKSDTKLLIEALDRLVSNGATVRSAAAIVAKDKSLGITASADAIRVRYYFHRKQKVEGINPNLPLNDAP
jgi:hypothetical protein